MKDVEKSGSKSSTLFITDSFGNREERGRYEVAFRRWIVREIASGRKSRSEVIKEFNLNPVNGDSLLRSWQKKYGAEIEVTLPAMSEKDKHKVEALQKRLEEMERQLAEAQMKNVALETLIDVAEEDFHISIRKKRGAGQ